MGNIKKNSNMLNYPYIMFSSTHPNKSVDTLRAEQVINLLEIKRFKFKYVFGQNYNNDSFDMFIVSTSFLNNDDKDYITDLITKLQQQVYFESFNGFTHFVRRVDGTNNKTLAFTRNVVYYDDNNSPSNEYFLMEDGTIFSYKFEEEKKE